MKVPRGGRDLTNGERLRLRQRVQGGGRIDQGPPPVAVIDIVSNFRFFGPFYEGGFDRSLTPIFNEKISRRASAAEGW